MLVLVNYSGEVKAEAWFVVDRIPISAAYSNAKAKGGPDPLSFCIGSLEPIFDGFFVKPVGG